MRQDVRVVKRAYGRGLQAWGTVLAAMLLACCSRVFALNPARN
jgi:hypothetical protein